MFAEFRRRFWLPPRAHGDVIEDRTVSFLELFYDLVYVVVIARAAHTLAHHVTWRTVAEFVVIFGMIWIAWMNGTLYYELHGREDGRTRVFVFMQMMLLVLLAVFTGDAASEGGVGFAVVYVLYLAVVTWLWRSVRRQDSDEYMAVTGRYVAGMAASIVVVAASALVGDELRVGLWALLVVGWLVGSAMMSRSSALEAGATVTDSMVERLGLLVIIVLGEVVVGVADGLTEAERSPLIVATGLIGLAIGFAYWWTYFDYVGRRLPVDAAPVRMAWMLLHYPVTLAIAGAGAAMVSLIDHAADARTPRASAWLLAGAIALGLSALAAIVRTLRDFQRQPDLYRPVSTALAVAAVAALLVGWWAPAPWVLAGAFVVILSAVWWFAVDRRLRVGEPSPG